MRSSSTFFLLVALLVGALIGPAAAQKLQPSTGIMLTAPTDGAGAVCTVGSPCATFTTSISGGTVAATQSGTWTVRLQDGSGTPLTTTTVSSIARLNVALAAGAVPGAAIPAYTDVVGGSDGTNARQFLTDTGGRLYTSIANGSTTAAVKAASTAAGATDPALVVAISPNNTVPVSLASLPALATGTNTIGTVRVAPPVAVGFTIAGCTVGASSAQCLAGATATNSLTIQNTSASVYIACKLGGTAILNDSGSFMLSPLQSRSWNINTYGVPVAALNCIAGSASTPLYVEYN